ncbi:SpoIIE family protein phosphatase [Amycolatopsis sp. YIM 10]|uniref:SpoIIE family protein phosphatase n=1 Tax=Amycolatopsis sp. YIM 10 TaxID=2653857 RepID=UPI00129062E4|nr:SpoIIE family protein phosphatase [Amycolatopsis sp. YIM 10]QFU86636.1 Serine/threonine-protein kinase RsbT [Amycolatopsis sp. YIM 10]
MGVMNAPGTTQIPVDHVSAAHVAARTARTAATVIGLPGPLPDRAAVVASELASNLDKHAWDGAVYVQPLLLGTGIDVTAVDRGPGMADPDRCLTDGHTTTGTLGVGLGAVRRMATEFVISSAPGDGTLVSARLRAPNDPARARLDLGHFVLPAEGEVRSGDLAAAAETATGEWTLLLADGLGHGAPAADAAAAAEQAFRRDPARPLPVLMSALHTELRHTRGAAVVLARLSSRGVSFCGTGNISGVVLTGTRNHHLLSAPGVVGLRAGRPHQHDVPALPGSTLVLHTDGLDHHWLLGPPAPPHPSAQLVAARLLRDHRVPADDAGVLVARLPESLP